MSCTVVAAFRLRLRADPAPDQRGNDDGADEILEALLHGGEKVGLG
jgi:hypothetical protein